MGLLDRFFGPNIEKLEAGGDTEALVDLLEHEKRDIRLQAVNALLRLEHPAVISALISALGDEDVDFVTAGKQGLEAFGSRAHAELARALDDEKLGPEALDILLRQREIPTLVEALRSGGDNARLLCAQALAKILPSTVDEERDRGLRAMRASLGDRLPEIRCIAASLLGEMHDERASKALAAQLKDGQEEVREACARALRSIGAAAVVHLLNALSSRSPRARAEAARILPDLAGAVDPDTRAGIIEDLEGASQDRDEHVRNAVAAALKNLGVPADAD